MGSEELLSSKSITFKELDSLKTELELQALEFNNYFKTKSISSKTIQSEDRMAYFSRFKKQKEARFKKFLTSIELNSMKNQIHSQARVKKRNSNLPGFDSFEQSQEALGRSSNKLRRVNRFFQDNRGNHFINGRSRTNPKVENEIDKIKNILGLNEDDKSRTNFSKEFFQEFYQNSPEESKGYNYKSKETIDEFSSNKINKNEHQQIHFALRSQDEKLDQTKSNISQNASKNEPFELKHMHKHPKRNHKKPKKGIISEIHSISKNLNDNINIFFTDREKDKDPWASNQESDFRSKGNLIRKTLESLKSFKEEDRALLTKIAQMKDQISLYNQSMDSKSLKSEEILKEIKEYDKLLEKTLRSQNSLDSNLIENSNDKLKLLFKTVCRQLWNKANSSQIQEKTESNTNTHPFGTFINLSPHESEKLEKMKKNILCSSEGTLLKKTLNQFTSSMNVENSTNKRFPNSFSLSNYIPLCQESVLFYDSFQNYLILKKNSDCFKYSKIVKTFDSLKLLLDESKLEEKGKFQIQNLEKKTQLASKNKIDKILKKYNKHTYLNTKDVKKNHITWMNFNRLKSSESK